MLRLQQRHDRHGGRSAVRRAAQGARVLEGIHAVLTVFVVDERHAVSYGRPGKDWGKRRDALDAGEHVRQLIDLVIDQVVQKDVGDPGPVGDECERTAVGRPDGIDVLPNLHVAQQLGVARVEMEQRDSQIPEPQQVEIGLTAALRHERDRLSVR